MSTSPAARRRLFPLFILVASIALPCGAAAATQTARSLTIEERVAAQVAIERVLYAHQLGARKPFGEAVPERLAREKVLRFLDQARVLHEVFGTTITTEMLEQETARIAARSHLPERLVEIFDALGNDTFLVKECFIRPRLVETLLVERFREEGRFQVAARELAERAAAAVARGDAAPSGLRLRTTTLEMEEPGVLNRRKHPPSSGRRIVPRDEYEAARSRFPERASEPSAVEETADGFQFQVLEQEGATDFRGVTYFAPKLSFSSWWSRVPSRRQRAPEATIAEGTPLPAPELSLGAPAGTYCAADDTWEASIAVPAPRTGAVAAGIGDSMLVWGGSSFSGSRGDRYFPATGEWTTFSALGAPTKIQFGSLPVETATFWTGQVLLAWSNPPVRYDPAADAWQPLSTLGAPSGGTPVWTGTHLIVVAGAQSARYDPSTDEWQPISTLGAPAGGVAAWTGQEVLVSTGARYDPATNAWSAISTAGACSGTHAFWTGDEFLVFRRTISWAATDSGCRYDPLADAWSPIAPQAAFADHVFWTGARLVTLSGRQNDTIASIAAYDPTADAWTTAIPVVTERYDTAAVSTGSELLLWGGQLDVTFGYVVVNTGVRLDAYGQLLGPTSLSRIPIGSVNHSTTWTGSESIVWGGWSRERGPYSTLSECRGDGSAFDPAPKAWRQLGSSGAPQARGHHSAIWTGNELLVWGGLGSCDAYEGGTPLDSGGRYDPLTDSWGPLATAGAPGPRFDHTAVWTGERMIIWGGAGGIGIVGDGAAYDPGTDTWIPVSAFGAPPARRSHTAVWTGAEMIVWGGTGSAVLGDGARLDSETGQWTALPSAQAPEPRTEHVAVWTGAEMLIWGGGPYPGCYGSDGPAGGRYSLALDAWSPISVIDAPRPDCRETAVWTGGEMMVSGGGAGRYSPTTDSWVSITTPSPWFSEVGSASVWTGAQMAIWGGYGTVAPSETFRDGALLNLGQLADADGDGVSICDGDCDDYDSSRYPAAAELCDGLDNDCDGVVDDVPDGDLDGLDDCADNCTLTYNPEQADGDADLEGDACDLDDGLLLFTGFEAGAQSWQPEVVYDSFNLYRGDLAVLRATGDYTQTLGNADRFCGLAGHAHQDPFEPPEGIVVYYLLTGVAGGVEGTLGTNSAGIERPNASPCP